MYFGSQEDGRFQTHLDLCCCEQMCCLQNIPHADYQTAGTTDSSGQLVHRHRLEDRHSDRADHDAATGANGSSTPSGVSGTAAHVSLAKLAGSLT